MKLRNIVSIGMTLGFLVGMPTAEDRQTLCNTSDFPEQLKNQLKAQFPYWKVQEESNLASMTVERWHAENPVECPGIATGKFENADTLSFAVLVVPESEPDSAYKLLAFTPGSATGIKIIEEWGKGGASHYFIHKVEMKKIFSPAWIKKLHVTTTEGILIADSTESEYGVDVYFYSTGQYRRESIDY